MVSTKLIGKLFVSRQKEIDRYAKEAEAIQVPKTYTNRRRYGMGKEI